MGKSGSGFGLEVMEKSKFKSKKTKIIEYDSALFCIR